jgi:hypothetical protein
MMNTYPAKDMAKDMNHVQINIEADGGFRATEVIADLRIVAETLFSPLKLVGFWDGQANGMHLCPQEVLGRECLHKLPQEDPRHVDYVTTADNDMRAILEVSFSHASLLIYLK